MDGLERIVTIGLATMSGFVIAYKAFDEFRRIVQTIARGVITFFTGPAKILVRVGDIDRKLEEHGKKIETIEKDLKINGGTSSKDMVREILRNQIVDRARTKELLNETNLAVFACDKDGECTWVSNPLAKMLGMSPEAAVGRGWVAGIHPDDRRRVMECWEYAVADKYQFDCTYRLLNGNSVRAVADALQYKFGEPVGFHGVVRNAEIIDMSKLRREEWGNGNGN